MVETITFGLFSLAFLLGIKHSVDADHVVAVSSILTRSTKLSKTIKLSISWALGHMTTAAIITFIIFIAKDLIFNRILGNFEIIVAFMLIGIGVLTLFWEFDIIQIGKHSHGHIHKNNDPALHDDHLHIENVEQNLENVEDLNHGHFLGIKKDTQAIAGIGIVHGLASNDELFILLTLTLGLNDYSIIFIGLLIFSIGVVFGMVTWGSLLNIPVLKMRKEIITKSISVTVAILAIIYGVYSLFGGEGINLFPVITD